MREHNTQQTVLQLNKIKHDPCDDIECDSVLLSHEFLNLVLSHEFLNLVLSHEFLNLVIVI